MLIPIVLFLLGLGMLIKGGDFFVDGATGIAKRFHIPELILGATVVSIGTTLPEVMVSLTSSLSGHSDIAYGNAIGSIICNTALIAAVTVAVKPSVIDRKSLRLPVTFFFLSAILYTALAYTEGFFGRGFGVLLLLLFVLYLFLTVRSAKKEPPTASREDSGTEKEPEASSRSTAKDILSAVLGAGLIAFGADLLVDNGTLLAREFGMPESVIALTFIAIGTSLPELVTAVTALVKGHGSLSLGNVIGANLLNLVLVNGVAITLSPFAVPTGKTMFGINSSLVLDIPLMLLSMLLLTLPALLRGRLFRAQGITLLVLYASFLALSFCL